MTTFLDFAHVAAQDQLSMGAVVAVIFLLGLLYLSIKLGS